MKRYNVFWRLVLLVVVMTQGAGAVKAQGDQILDGIGETSMIARYVLNGDLRDWSRNNLHASHGGQAKFATDQRFGNVLNLTGESTDFIKIPAEALTDFESISISAWVFLRSDKAGQYLFDFGKNATSHFFAAPAGTTSHKGLQTQITSNGNHTAANSVGIELNKWVLLTVVVNIPSKTLTNYIDGVAVGTSNNIPNELDEVFAGQNQLFIGKSILGGSSNINALVRDFRIYRVPLTPNQINGILNATRRGASNRGVNTVRQEDNLPTFTVSQSQLYNKYLVSVSDVTVSTAIGELPRLPSFVDGTYEGLANGPKVRVIWPAPNDNNTVLSAGKYTIEGTVPGTDFKPKAVVTVDAGKKSSTPGLKLAPFHLSHVTLDADANNEETKFIENRDKFINTLAKTDPNSFLYMFRHAFGQPQPEGAKALGTWDSKDTKLRGHATGHYLTAIAQSYASTSHDKTLQANFLQKMNTMVNTLYDLQQLSGKPKAGQASHVADPTKVPMGPGKTEYDSDLSDEGIRNDYWNWGEGFISAYPPDQFIMLEHGAKYGGQKNQIWAPYYTLHKIIAGLIDIYEVSGNEKALKVAVGMSDWVHARLSQLPKATLIEIWNTYIAGEYGGMNETMAHMYRITNNDKYLQTAQLFDNIDMFYGDGDKSHGLAKNVDTFRGLHANQHIPQIVGAIETYRVSNREEYFKIADNFWYKAVNDYMYSIGGVAGARNPANAEVFTAEPATLYQNGFAQGGQNETCATYNMLKLTSNLFLFDQRTELMDYYERGLYNHILASVAENSPANTYHVPLRPGSVKGFGNPNMTGFTCCNGTAIESSTKLQNSIYYKSLDNKALFVNLYVPSTLTWEEQNVTVVQTTAYPKEDQTRLTIKGSGKFDVHVRVPSWATNGFFVKINGKAQKIKATPGSYVKLSRKWKNGDVIDLKMPFGFRLESVMDQQNIASLFYGPILLAAQETQAMTEWRKVTFDATDLSKSITGDPKKLEFMIDGIQYKPFYDTYGRHSVYFDVTLK
jgi:DUF1680 family protein